MERASPWAGTTYPPPLLANRDLDRHREQIEEQRRREQERLREIERDRRRQDERKNQTPVDWNKPKSPSKR